MLLGCGEQEKVNNREEGEGGKLVEKRWCTKVDPSFSAT